ncbi:sulfatase family protein [Roseivirga pacifica]|uniref:sulfatase family protein n=1 Tax=Roseivirga pacifica TaxID=1267423 RepID=UPI00209619BD|nr:sulfatase [Roseivirga pacifica]MCO6357782.1 sulfatase-like hydrolase/transferase [Roseivirga pacifica]MCO6366035.1 sulfatase-like hydrolase/transferase [Roseivirga pacifica]MCO6371363.1 sulfatase-like hydrolase/transferase [Roseivirga pacifica]MCO6375465.1 sulfatase-like hydrolase/transferase [Roseivirga pacifica]MCO6378741.1 sulfatase-like hydrolase/transferase [Roseivirga pacifica]
MKNSLLLIVVLFAIYSCQTTTTKTPSKPNVIIIFTDDQGYQDVGSYGAVGFKTPNLDQMAAEGIRLTDFYAAQAVCSASRAGLLTGCYPNRLGIHGAFMPNSPKGLNPEETTIAEMLKTEGYKTAIYGKWHLGDAPEFLPTKQGFDEYFGIPFSNDMWPYHPQQGTIFNFGPLPLYENENIIDTLTDQSNLTTQITERSIQFIQENKSEPFFLYVAHPQPHVPLFVSDKFKGKSERGLYGDVIMEIDWSVGEILKTLKQEGIDENTMVIFTSDNGPWLAYGEHSGSAFPLREGKGTALEGGQREPAVIRYPGKIKPGRTLQTPMMNIDILPTIAELTGAQLPTKNIDGKSVWKIWTGESDESPQEAYYFYYHVNELQGVRYKNWKMYFPHKYRTLGGREGGKDGLPADYEYVTFDEIALYDLSKDISETNNVANEHPDVVEEIKALANGMRNKLGDALTNVEGTENRAPGMINK